MTYATSATLFGPDGEEQQRQQVDDAATLGSPLLRVFQGTPSVDDHVGWERAREVVRYAADRGVKLGVENFARAPGVKDNGRGLVQNVVSEQIGRAGHGRQW